MKLSFGIVFAVVAVLGCSAVSIPAGPVSDASLRKLKASEDTRYKEPIYEPPPQSFLQPECVDDGYDHCHAPIPKPPHP